MIRNLAVVGATGAVGRIVLDEIQRRNFPYENIKLLASGRSAGKTTTFGGRAITIEEMQPDSFNDVDLVIASTPDEVAAEFVPWAVERGAVVVDESAYFRMDPDVPLVIPEVNPQAIAQHKGIIASPNCSTTQMVVAIKPLYDAVGIKRVIVSTYQAVSGAGLAAQSELVDATNAHLNNKPFTPTMFAHPIAFNLIPQIGSPKHEGYTSEEMKMVYETHKIMGDDSIAIHATCVRVPVLIGHSETIYVETKDPISVEEAMKLFRSAPGITLVDDLAAKKYPMPMDCAGKDDVFVGRIRKDLHNPRGISFWCVSDNLRKGAATNAVQIAEHLARHLARV